MSLINATLVAQAIHFSIAFLLIKYLFLKPAYAQIEQEDKLQESLIATVQSHQQTVGAKEQELVSQWYALRSYFASHVPIIRSADAFLEKMPHIKLPEFEPRELNDAIETTSREIIKKVNNVR